MKPKTLKIASVIVVICFIQIVIIGGGQNPFALKDDELIFQIAKLELLNQVKLEKNIPCFSVWHVEDLTNKKRLYKWIKTWKNRSDTIFVFAFVERGYWGGRYSYMFGNSYTTGNEDLIRKLRITDMKDPILPPHKLDEEEIKLIVKYKDYKLCD